MLTDSGPTVAASKHTTASINHTRPSTHKHSPDGATPSKTADIRLLLTTQLSTSSAGQGKLANWRRTFYHWDTQPTKAILFQAAHMLYITRRQASADRTAHRQFQATGQPVGRTQASDAMTSRLPSYDPKCVQHRCFQWGSVPLHSDISGMELPAANILIPLERQFTALLLCCWEFLYNEILQQTFCPLLSKFCKRWQI